MTALALKIHNEDFSIHRLNIDSKIPNSVFNAPIYFVAKTYEEISIVLPSNIELKSDKCETDWKAYEVVGPLDFSLTGILSNIASVLANEKISIFAISTFDTDYILVKSNTLQQATLALRNNNFEVI